MVTDCGDRAEPQQLHQDITYSTHPARYGDRPSAPAVCAANVFRNAGAQDAVERGAVRGTRATVRVAGGLAANGILSRPRGGDTDGA
jgi:hypothetical protein